MAKTKKNGAGALGARRIIAYLVLGALSLICLFAFYILLINSTRAHTAIQRGFSLVPGKSFLSNLKNVLNNKTILIARGLFNSVLVAGLTAALSVYFSAMTAYAVHAYEFRLKKIAFTFILLIMTVPTQVSALGFVRLVNKMGMMNTFTPLILPAVAAPTVFFS